MQTIFSKMLYEIEHQQDTMLVTIVADHGSAPRSAGARMLVGACGRIHGSIGGGAVEKRSEELAMHLIREKKSIVHDYRLRMNDVEDLGMVCGGDVTVLFEYIRADDAVWAELAQQLVDRIARHERGWLICPLDGGNPSLYDESGTLVAGQTLPTADMLAGTAPLLIDNALFAEPLPIGERVLIFGAGHISMALAPLLSTLDFRPVIYDNRPEYADPASFPHAEAVLCGDFESIHERLEIQEDDYVVIMTSGHAHDRTVQAQVMLGGKYAYLGVIGSRAKIASINKALLELGVSQSALDNVYTPIGVPIKAVTPAEIAVSIAGELIRVRAERREAGKHIVHGCPMH